MRRFEIFFLLFIQPILVSGQQVNYTNYARDKIIDKSWECVRFCINGWCTNPKDVPRYISYFQARDMSGWVGEKYESRLRYCAVKESAYQVDSLNNYLKNSEPSDLPTWLFIDSNSKKKGQYIVVRRSPLYEDEGSGIEDGFFGVSILSDSEFVSTWKDRLGTHRNYYKRYTTPLEFYREHKIELH